MAKKRPDSLIHEAQVYGDDFRFAAQDERIPRFYIVLESEAADTLVEAVQCKIHEGWVPQGGLAIKSDRFWQAMVRY